MATVVAKKSTEQRMLIHIIGLLHGNLKGSSMVTVFNIQVLTWFVFLYTEH